MGLKVFLASTWWPNGSLRKRSKPEVKRLCVGSTAANIVFSGVSTRMRLRRTQFDASLIQGYGVPVDIAQE